VIFVRAGIISRASMRKVIEPLTALKRTDALAKDLKVFLDYDSYQ
jgi:hypothetical protein